MYDFTQTNYMYQSYEDDLLFRNALRDCKTKEDEDELIMMYQGMPLLSRLAAFVFAVVICGIISLFV